MATTASANSGTQPALPSYGRHGLIQLNPEQTEENTKLDLVVLPGLDTSLTDSSTRNHAVETFTENNVLWIRDFLGEDLPEARVFLFGYSARVTFSNDISMRDHAEQLLGRLKDKRTDRSRPIFWMGYSLGGLVIKETLVYAKRADDLKPIFLDTACTIFLGTPHKGANGVSFGKIFHSIADAISHQSGENEWLKSVEKNSLVAIRMADDYRDFLENFEVITAWETRPTNGVMVVEKESALLNLPANRERKVYLHRNHLELPKFSKKDEDYESLKGAIKGKVERALETVANRERLQDLSVPLSAPTLRVPIHEIRDADIDPFFGRTAQMDRLKGLLQQNWERPGTINYRAAIHGPAGAGKTALANKFCHHLIQSVNRVHIFWVRATSNEAIQSAFVDLAKQANIYIPPDKPENYDEICTKFKRWLEGSQSGSWVLVLDEMDNRELEARKYLPLKRGNILVTTKEEKIVGDLVPVGRAIHVAEMNPEDAFTMLQTLSTVSLVDDIIHQEAQELLERLDYMALPIRQAANYIRENKMRISEYIRLFDQSDVERDSMLSLVAEYAWDENERPTKAMMTTWTITFRRLSGKHPTSLDLLRRMSLLDSVGLTFDILDPSLELHKGFIDDMNPLLTLSMVSKSSGQYEVYQMHNLVSFCTRLQMESENVFPATLRVVIDHVASRMLQVEKSQEVSAILPHSLRVSSHALSKNISTESLATLENSLAKHLIQRGNHKAGLLHGTIAYNTRNATHSTASTDFTDILETLAHANFMLENFPESRKWLSLTLAEKQKCYGEDDMRTWTTVGRMASLFQFQGQPNEAIYWHKKHLESVKRIQGPQSDGVIRILINLGNVYFHPVCNYAKAHELHTEALTLALHSTTIDSSVMCQAKIVKARDMSKLHLCSEARELLEEVMDEYRQSDVPNWNDFAYLNEDIAETYLDERLYSQSERHHLLALDQYRLSNTPTPKILGNIGEMYKRMGETTSIEGLHDPSAKFYDASKYFFMLSLREKEKIYGKEHSSTILTMRNIADLYLSIGIPTQTLHWYKKALVAGERSLEAKDPIRFRHRHLIARTLKVLGRLEEAAEACKDALEGRRRLLEETHIDCKESVELLLDINDRRAALREEWENEDGWNSLVPLLEG